MMGDGMFSGLTAASHSSSRECGGRLATEVRPPLGLSAC